MDGADEQQDADRAEAQLRRGIARSRRIVAHYKQRLTRLRESGEAGERPLFRWRKDD